MNHLHDSIVMATSRRPVDVVLMCRDFESRHPNVFVFGKFLFGALMLACALAYTVLAKQGIFEANESVSARPEALLWLLGPHQLTCGLCGRALYIFLFSFAGFNILQAYYILMYISSTPGDG